MSPSITTSGQAQRWIPSTAITIVGPTVTGMPATAITVAPTVAAGETVAQYAVALKKALTTAGINTGPDGVSVTASGGRLSIVGPAATLKTAGIASQDLSTTTISYDFGTSASSIATVDPKTNLTITGLTATGATATSLAPKVTLGESLAQYVNDLTTALATAGIAGVTVSSSAARSLVDHRRQSLDLRQCDPGSCGVGQLQRDADLRFERQSG